jgi:hypothetical protein
LRYSLGQGVNVAGRAVIRDQYPRWTIRHVAHDRTRGAAAELPHFVTGFASDAQFIRMFTVDPCLKVKAPGSALRHLGD